MGSQNIVAIGASAGGVDALQQMVSGLPADYSGSMFVVLHMPPDAPTLLPKILNRAGRLPAVTARDGDRIQRGHIYVAPPDHHLMLNDGFIRLTSGPRENRHRPSIDVLFRSVAKVYGPRSVAVLLSGMRDDGVSGLIAVKRQGGTVLIQKPTDADFPELPKTGIALDSPDSVLSAADIATELVRLAQQPAGETLPIPMDLEKETRYAEGGAGPEDVPPGTPADYACPECNGSLWRLDEKELTRYRCRVGHAYTQDNLVLAKSEALESALWAALRALEESVSIERRAAKRADDIGSRMGAERLQESAETKSKQAELLRQMLIASPPGEQIKKTGTED